MITTEMVAEKLNELVFAEVEKVSKEINVDGLIALLLEKTNEEVKNVFIRIFENDNLKNIASEILSELNEEEQEEISTDKIKELAYERLSDDEIIELVDDKGLKEDIADRFIEYCDRNKAREIVDKMLDDYF